MTVRFLTPPVYTARPTCMGYGSAPVIVLPGSTRKRRFPFHPFHRSPPVYRLRVHWGPLMSSLHRRRGLRHPSSSWGARLAREGALPGSLRRPRPAGLRLAGTGRAGATRVGPFPAPGPGASTCPDARGPSTAPGPGPPPALTRRQVGLGPRHCQGRRASQPHPVAARRTGLVPFRWQHVAQGLLEHAVPHRGETVLADTAPRLGHLHPPHRARASRPGVDAECIPPRPPRLYHPASPGRVPRLARAFHAAVRPHLAVTPWRFPGPSAPRTPGQGTCTPEHDRMHGGQKAPAFWPSAPLPYRYTVLLSVILYTPGR